MCSYSDGVHLGPEKDTCRQDTVYQNGSINTGFDPPLFSLVSIFKHRNANFGNIWRRFHRSSSKKDFFSRINISNTQNTTESTITFIFYASSVFRWMWWNRTWRMALQTLGKATTLYLTLKQSHFYWSINVITVIPCQIQIVHCQVDVLEDSKLFTQTNDIFLGFFRVSSLRSWWDRTCPHL